MSEALPEAKEKDPKLNCELRGEPARQIGVGISRFSHPKLPFSPLTPLLIERFVCTSAINWGGVSISKF